MIPPARTRLAIARLRNAVRSSDSHTAPSTSSRRPANADNPSAMTSLRSSSEAPGGPTSVCVVIAPMLIIGLRGRPVSRLREIWLNASPDGSTSTFSRTASIPRSRRASA